MRLKLVMIASLLAAVAGAGASVLIVAATWGSFYRVLRPSYLLQKPSFYFALFAPTLLAALLASLFVYRHTARKRKLQGALTLVLVLFLSLGSQLVWHLLK